MLKFIIDLVISAVILQLTSRILPGFYIPSFSDALLVALVISLLNLFIKPLLVFLTLPITVLTLGLFLFVISAVILQLAAWLIGDFSISSFGIALLAAVIISLLSTLVRLIVK